jgi:sulfate permease
MILSIAMIIAFFFAMNIGASGTAASMGAAYGGGAIRKRWAALLLVAGSVFLGACLGGGEVVKTISGGIIPAELLNVELTLTILASACLTLFMANLMAIPLSTSEVTVGAVIGVGMAYRSVYLDHVLAIMLAWIALPFTAFAITYLLAKLLKPLERVLEVTRNRFWKRAVTILLILAGCFEAFSAGMNNVANAVGPLVGARLIDTAGAIVWGGLFVSFGALLLGGRVLETNAKKITKLSLLKSSAVSLTSGTLVVIASVFGIPVPLTQATTMSIFGIGAAGEGRGLWKSDIVKRVLKVWILSPVLSLAVSYIFVETFLFREIYGILLLIALATASLIYLGIRRGRKASLKSKSLG